MADADQTIALIDRLTSLRPALVSGDDQSAKNEAIQLSRKITASLVHPASAAVELAFAVRLMLNNMLILTSTDADLF